MPIDDLALPERLLAGGGPSSPDPRVLRALTTPVIGQFDPEFTAIMDDVVRLARQTLLTANPRCFAISSLAAGGLEAVFNSLLEDGDQVAVGGGPGFVARTANIARRCGARIVSTDEIEVRPTSRLFCESQSAELLVTDWAQGRGQEIAAQPTFSAAPLGHGARLLVVPLIDPDLGSLSDVAGLARACHQHGVRLVVEATLGLGARELRVDDWAIDACVAGVDHALGAPSGLTLVTYSSEIEAMLAARRSPPRTSYLDLIQLQAYWSPERLNHHTAPTSLVYGLREALRLIHAEGLQQRWHRHHRVGVFLRQGLEALGLVVHGEPPVCIVQLPRGLDEAAARRSLLDEYGVHVSRVGVSIWRVGLLGADARLDAARRVLAAFEAVLSGSEATSEAGALLVPERP